MNLRDQVIYRCIHAACARPLPREVNFCPYCGTGQHEGVVNPAHVARPAQAEYRPAPEPAPAQPTVAAVVAPAALAAPAAPIAPIAPAPPPKAAVPPTPPRAAPTAAPPPQRRPVPLRYWLIALATLWLVWLYARPSTQRVEARIQSAITASAECRLNDAQSELIALRMTKASQEQLERLQQTINTAASMCNKKNQRIKAWSDTAEAVDNALADADFARAQARLTQFTRRWNEDAETRRVKERIAAQRAAATQAEAPAPAPQLAPARSPAQQSQSVRNLIDEAERALAAGNYKAASDKLETCITMVDAGNRECAAFKVHADRMQMEQRRCLASGREWYDDRCH